MQALVHLKVHIYFLVTMIRINVMHINKKICSIAAGVGNGLISKHFRLSRILLGDSALATVLILGFVFGLIQKSAASVPVLTGTDVTTTYSSALTVNSPMLSRHADQMEKRYYFESIQVNVLIKGTYIFTSNSSINMYGYLYDDQFNPADLSLKLISENDDSNGQGQFRIAAILQSDRIYILVVTTFSPATTGQFSILSSGLAPVDMYTARVSEVSAAGRVARSTTLILSSYLGTLSSSSPTFTRPNLTTGYYYYQTIRVTVSTPGIYSFTSSSSIDTYGCFYYDSFNPFYSSQNLIKYDDDGDGGGQFRIEVSLVSARIYILVVTTYTTGLTGSFLITMFGPASVDLISFPQSSTNPSCNIYGTCYTGNTKKTVMIVGITIGCIVLCLIICGVYVCKQKQTVSNPESNSLARNQGVPTHVYRVTYFDRNAIRTNTVQIPYTISMTAAYANSVEEPPPSYDVAVSSQNAQERWNSNRL